MDAKEFRIGNIINLDGIGPVRITGILQDKVYYALLGWEEEFVDWAISLKYYWKPIPLTEEWLEKFGFVETYRDAIVNHTKGDLVIEQNGVHITARFKIDDEHSRFIIIIKYVHQLQNLYYCLTGKELEIKESESKHNAV